MFYFLNKENLTKCTANYEKSTKV